VKHFVVLVLAVAVLLASCGGDGGGPDATPSVEPTAVPTTAPTATPAPAPTDEPTFAPPPPTSPPSQGSPSTVISRGDASQNNVVLTFDAGSDAGYTSMILDTLASNGITAAFGITGRWAEANPDLLRRIVNEGHSLINHSYNHSSFTGYSSHELTLTREQRWDQLDRTEAVVQQIAGATTFPYFRPPYGDYDASVNADVGARGYRYNVMWTVDSMGWNGYTQDAIVERCLSMAAPGAIYIFHVGSASQDGPALQRVIDGLRGRGYAFVPLETFAP
jgi:peptidoglycan/xylan/chitin deacetylase (PgdA/CDA1 family)